MILLDATRVIYGAYWIFIGLNGFFAWRPIPFVSTEITEFMNALGRVRFIMPTVKGLEIFVGVLLVTQISPLLALLVLAPILFGIIGLHLAFNSKPWLLCTLLTIPYFALLASQGHRLAHLLF